MERVELCCVELGELPGDAVSWEQSGYPSGYSSHLAVLCSVQSF